MRRLRLVCLLFAAALVAGAVIEALVRPLVRAVLRSVRARPRDEPCPRNVIIVREQDPRSSLEKPTPLAVAGMEYGALFHSLREAFENASRDPRPFIPDMIAVVRLAHAAGDDSIGEALVGAFFDRSLPPGFRYVIPSLLLPMPSGERFLRELTLRESEADCVALNGLFVALKHVDAKASTLWANEVFWTGYFLANSGDFGSEFSSVWEKEQGTQPRPSGGPMMGYCLGYEESRNSHLPSAVVAWIAEGFKDENRIDVASVLMYHLLTSREDELVLRFVIAFYKRARTPEVASRALEFLDMTRSDLVGPVFQEVLEDDSDLSLVQEAIGSEYVLASSDPSLVRPLLECYARYHDSLNISCLYRALAHKDSSEAYAFLGGRLSSAPEDVLLAIPGDLPEAVANRARTLLELAAQSASVETRLKAYQAHIRAIPTDRMAVLQRAAVTETDECVRRWALQELKPR